VNNFLGDIPHLLNRYFEMSNEGKLKMTNIMNMTEKKSKKIFDKLRAVYGEIHPELNYSGLYQLAISVVLSAQTTDRQVNAATPALFTRFPDFKSLSKGYIPEVERLIKTVGLYKTKAKNIINLAGQVINNHNGILPDRFEDLINLPGIGRKSANVILSQGYNKAALAVDTHVMRIANRLGYIKSADPYKVEKALTRFIPKKDWKSAHLLLIKHGRTLCRARNPLCGECPVISLCDYQCNIS
jgi:endonuclease-3